MGLALGKGPLSKKPRKSIVRSESESRTPTTLYVRHCSRLSFNHNTPTKYTANALLEDFCDRFKQWEDSYKDSISSLPKLSGSTLEFAEDGCRPLRWERSSRVLDCPRLRISYGGLTIETRICLAICTTNTASSKIWARVTLPVDVPGISPRIMMGQVSKLCPQFREIADTSVDWVLSKLFEILPNHLPNSTHKHKGIVKATILGVMDDDMAEPFESLYEEGVTAADVLKDTTLDSKLTSYCKRVSSIEGMLSTYNDKQTETSNLFWYKIPLWTTLYEGEIVPRAVLFYVRDLADYSEIIGLTCDDSKRGNLALRAGAKLSNIIGHWI